MWVAYVLVDDLAAATHRAKSLGASVMKEATVVKDAGSFVIINDPTGGMLARRETAPHRRRRRRRHRRSTCVRVSPPP
jgi:hypothetical protein